MSKKKNIIIIIVVIAIIIIGNITYKKFTSNGLWLGDYKYMYQVEDNTLWAIDYRGDNREVKFPTTLFGKDIYVEPGIFNHNSTIEKFFIPKDVDNYYYVSDCSALREVEYEDGTGEIKVGFKDCENLETVIIPETTSYLPSDFCYGCKMLKEIYIPDGVGEISGGALLGSGFEEIHINDKYVVVGDGILLFYHGERDEIVIPSGVKKVTWECIFGDESHDQTRTMYFSDSVEELGNMDIYEDVIAYFGSEQVEGLKPENVEGTIVAPAGSYMEQFCKDNNLNFRVMTEEEEATWREKTEAAASEIVYQE